uniref:Uncharacterized protein n=1 Tax=Arundo donax TaxID=35708 RepID=A0A0A9GNE9_ARUDO
MEVVRYQAAHFVQEAELVGFSGPKEEILDLISSSASAQLHVIWIIGAGGLGKTTLAKKVYESSEISARFTCRAWVTVSQSFNVKELLKEMINQLLGAESLRQLLEQCTGFILNETRMADHLKNGLKEIRYFLVLDDLWTIEAWDCIKPTFWGDNENGSRVVVTSRNGNLVEGSGPSSLVHHLKTLAKEDATKLLLRKTNRSLDDIKKDQMTQTFDKIIKKCGGVPLAVVTIGGVLATKHVKEWDNLYNQLPSELETNPSLESMRKVIMMSYNHLPSHLKPCFLYLSIFPEDFEIKRRCLVDRWIAEGLVPARLGMTVDDVGETYFSELIDRSMIQPSKVNIEGRIKSCRVHDIMRDIIVSISREENFVYSAAENVPRVVEHNFRHVAYHGDDCTTIGMDWSRVRSLTIFGERPVEPVPSLCSSQLRMLRAMDLENAQFAITQKEINNIGLLRHLKYVNVCYGEGYSNIYALPRSIGKLEDLQILDLRDSHISTLPTEISKLKSLRKLRCSKRGYYKYFDPDAPKECLVQTLCMPIIFTPLVDSQIRNEIIANLHMAYSSRCSITKGVRVPKGIGNLKELQILQVVDIKRTSSKVIEELGELSQLRKLSVTMQGATKKKCMIFCKAIQKLSSLGSLRIDAGDGTLEWLDSVSSPPLLSSLSLLGHIGDKADWFRNLTQLLKIRLVRSKLEEGKTMEVLGALPKLMLLDLGRESYVANALVFGKGAFLNLRKLDICDLIQLREIGFEQGASPQVESIEIGDCRLESGINGIKHLPKLKDISLWYGSMVARLGTLQEEVGAHPNQPVLRLRKDRSYHDLGDVGGSEVEVEATESIADHAREGSEAVTLTTSDS